MTVRRASWWLAVLVLSATVSPAAATVFHARDEALELAFPAADRTEARDFYLTRAQHEEIEQIAAAELDSDLLTVYAGYEGERLLGYAIFDTHVVRTLPETFLVVLAPDGRVTATHVLAFYEPLEYAPGERWLEQFRDKREPDALRIGQGIAAITGSTLTSHAVAAGIRRALAIHHVLLREGHAHAQALSTVGRNCRDVSFPLSSSSSKCGRSSFDRLRTSGMRCEPES
jgi:transcriptional regulator of nitric oxide reductase